MDNVKLQNILNEVVDNNKVFGTSFCIRYGKELWEGSSGNLDLNSQYFIASTTKLFITSIILNFKSKGLLELEHKICNYLDFEILKGLHILDNIDYSKNITIKNLLAHTSGIPDYFQTKEKNGDSIENRLIKGEDMSWNFEDIINYNKKIKPLFAPNSKNKANYSDTNFQLLGKIIENISNKSISDNLHEIIFEPLNLKNTYLYTDIKDTTPKNIYFKNKEIFIPKAMSSFKSDGGIVSTSKELNLFLYSFFNGKIFPENYINDLKIWNRIFFPLKSGIGIHKFELPMIFDPFKTIPEFIGHSGLSGTLSYCNKEKQIYISGTVNQIAYPETSFKLLIKLIRKIL